MDSRSSNLSSVSFETSPNSVTMAAGFDSLYYLYSMGKLNCSCFEEACTQGVPYFLYAHFRDKICGASGVDDDERAPVPGATLPIQPTGQAVLIAAYVLAIVLSVLGNLTVIVVLSRCERSRSDLNVFLINLAVADIAMAAFCMPFTFQSILYQRWTFGDFMCQFVHFMQQVSVLVSIFTLLIISVDRWRAVENPLLVRVRSPSYRKMVTVAAVWLLAVNMSIVQLVVTHTKTHIQRNVTITRCEEDWSGDPMAPLIYEICFSLFFFLLPLLVMCSMYGRIANRLWTRNIPQEEASGRRYEQRLRLKWKVIRMVLLVVLAFFLCWLPLHVLRLVVMANRGLMSRQPHSIMIVRAYFAVHYLAMAHSTLNPVIYTFLNENFRADLRQLLSCRLKRKWRRQQRQSFSSRTESTRTSSIRIITVV